jgi:hypothetical protein
MIRRCREGLVHIPLLLILKYFKIILEFPTTHSYIEKSDKLSGRLIFNFLVSPKLKPDASNETKKS